MRTIEIGFTDDKFQIYIDDEVVTSINWTSQNIRRVVDSDVDNGVSESECVEDFMEMVLWSIDGYDSEEEDKIRELLEEFCVGKLEGYYQCAKIAKYQKEYEDAFN